MHTSSLVIDKARQLTASGQDAEVVTFLAARQGSELAESASLALLYGTAQARLGRHDDGLQWLDAALEQARKGGERGVERRRLKPLGMVRCGHWSCEAGRRFTSSAESWSRRAASWTRSGTAGVSCRILPTRPRMRALSRRC